MELTILSNYGELTETISKDTNTDEIKMIMNKIDWNNFHQVVLSTSDNNWLEVGGNTSGDGLSAIYEENGKQYVINKPPLSIAHMTTILLSYYNRDGKFKIDNKFE